jgi:hypothetical protein
MGRLLKTEFSDTPARPNLDGTKEMKQQQQQQQPQPQPQSTYM